MTAPYAYPVGAHVTGTDAAGRKFAGTVIEVIGPYSVRITPNTIVPAGLLDPPARTEPAAEPQQDGRPVQQPAAAAQLDLF